MNKNAPILLVDADDTIERPIQVLIKKKLVKSNVVVHATQDPVLFTKISESFVDKQNYHEIDTLMYFLPKFRLLPKQKYTCKQAEKDIYESVKWN